MKRIIYLILLALTAYVAGMFRSLPLLVLFAAGAVSAVVLAVLPHIAKKRITAEFQQKTITAAENETVCCKIKITVGSRLPTGRIKLRFRISYGDGKRCTHSEYVQPGQKEAELRLVPEYCGLLTVTLDRLKVFDPLMIFPAAKTINDRSEIAVLPADIAVKINADNYGNAPEDSDSDLSSDIRGEVYGEIRQVREYRDGDPLRHIHCNISARKDEFYVKEFESEPQRNIGFLLDMSSKEKPGAKQRSAVYKTLYSIVAGLMTSGISVTLFCGSESIQLRSTAQLRNVLCGLYKKEFPDTPQTDCELKLNTFGELYYRGSLVRKFEPDNISEQLINSEISL